MKINLRESLNKIDLATNNKYDLLNTFNSKKLSDNNKKKLAEAIENNSMASVNKILHESEEQLFKVVIQSGATKRDFESALYEDEAEEIVDYYGGRWIDENGFEWNMYVEEDDESAEHAYEESLNESIDPVIDVFNRGSEEYFKLDKVASWMTYFSPNKVYYAVEQTYFDYGQDWKWTTIIAYRPNSGDSWQAINPKQQESILACTTDEELEEVAKNILRESRLDKGFDESLTESSYGGAYDIEDDMFFTKEEIVDFADGICGLLNDKFGYQYDIEDVWMDTPTKLHISIYDSTHDFSIDSDFRIDMRKIRKPQDLVIRYTSQVFNVFEKKFEDEYQYYNFDESLNEKLIPAPQEVVDELLSILEKYDFVLDDSLRHPIGKTWSGNTHVQVINKNSHMEETDDPDIYFEQLKLYVPDEMENKIDALSEREKVRITYNFGINRNWQVTGGLDVWEKHVPGLQDESLKEQVSFPGYAVKYTTGYSGNGVNSGKTEWFRTEEERDKRVKELKDKNYTEIKTWKMDNFYHTPPKNESLKEDYKKLFGYNMLSSTLKDGGDTYALLRKTEDGKTKWAAAKYVNGIPDEDNIFEITYEQARGFEPLTDTGKVSKKLGKALLPKKENLKEDLSDLDLILNTPVDTKQFNEETFRALKNLVSEYKKDLNSLDQWALESEKEPFVKKWYKLADKCKEIAKNGIRGITGYGRLNDAIKLKVVDLARSVDNTFPWYTRNNLAKFNELESLQEKLNNIEKHDIIKAIVNGEEDDLQTIVDEIYFYDRALYLKLRHFVKKNSLNDKKDYLIKVLQDSLEESLTEDTVKQNGKWVNKGSEGTHGKFRTKKAADTQRKAMFANGYKSESLEEAIDDEIDLDYETGFDDDSVEEGNVFTEGGVDYAWIEREAGPIYLDFDKWAVWSAREYVDPREFMTMHDDGEGYDFDSVAFKKKAMAAPIVYFVVEEDTGFIDWGPEDSEIAAKDFLNGKKEDWENDMDESLNEDKDLKEYYTVNLHYEDIGDGKEYDYEADYDDVLEYLMDYCVDMEDDAPEDTQEYMEWVVDNFNYLLKKYEYEVLEHFKDAASQEEYDERNRSYEPEYDPMDW